MARLRQKFLAALALSVGMTLTAWAQSSSISSEDAASIRAVIDSQIQAFRRDDGENAYSHAAPSIQKIFPSVARFMDMVKRGYRPVYRPQSYTFEDLRSGDKGPVQAVRLVGPSNREWIAFYTFEKQPDGTWKISGVYIQAAPGTTT